MTVSIEVVPDADDEETSFRNLVFVHLGCDGVRIKASRNPVTNDYSLECACGLSIQLPAGGEAIRMFELTAIDELPRTLSINGFSSNRAGSISINARGAANRSIVADAFSAAHFVR